MKEIALTQGKVALVDDEDYALVSAITWCANAQAGHWYAVAPHRKLKMHRLILRAPAGTHVDHVNGDGLDNRRANLRLATRFQNAANRRKSVNGRNYRSKYKGVRPNAKKFQAVIGVRRKLVFIGSFSTELEAARAYDVKAREVFGEFAQLNFP